MSAYENVIGGRLKLKGKALDVKAGGIIKKKKNLRYKKHRYQDQSAAEVVRWKYSLSNRSC